MNKIYAVNQNEKNYQDYYQKRFVTESRPIKKIKNYVYTDRIKSGASDTQQTTDEYYTDHSYNAQKKEPLALYNNKSKKLIEENNSNIRKNKNSKNNNNNIQPSYKDNNNDIIRINTFTYFSETNVKTKGRSVSSAKKENCFENKLGGGKVSNKAENNNQKVLNRIELDNNKNKNNFNASNINNKNISTKITHKIRSNYKHLSNDLNKDLVVPEQKLARYVRRNNKNEKCLSFNESNLNEICDNTLNTMENKYMTKSKKQFKVNNFELTYETDQEERNNCNNSHYNHGNTMTNILSYPYQNEFKYNIYYNNIINLEDSNKYNNNNYEEINENTYDSCSNNNYYPYKYHMIHTSNLNEISKKSINLYDNMIDTYDDSDIFNNINNKSVTFGNVKRRKAKSKNINKSTNFSKGIKSNKTNSIKHLENQSFINNIRNSSIDIKINSPNSNKDIIKTNYNINSNNVFDNQSTAHSISVFAKKNSNSSLGNNLNSSKMSKKICPQIAQKKKGKKYFKKNDLKKIILIQSKYRSHLLNLKMPSNLLFNVRELMFILKDIFIFNYWKYFIQKLSASSSNKLVKKAKNAHKKNSMKKKNKLLLKNDENNDPCKNLGESFNIKNDNNYLKLKLNDVIKENSQLKSQIFDNRKIEEKLKQLQFENKKNQNINAIIIKDNQNLAKKLKNIQESRNNKLVIQNQPSLDLSQEDNMQMHSFSKLKFLNLKCLILKKFLKNGNILKIYFNKYRNNIKKEKDRISSIENNNIFINNRNKINMQMAKNFNINFFSQDDNYKYFILYKFFLKKDKLKKDTLSKYIFKFFYMSKYLKLFENIKNKEQEINKEKEINEIEKKEENNELKRSKLQSIIDKYERNIDFLFKNTYKEWKLRSVLFKMKDIAKEIKKRKKLKKKIREKIAKQTLNNLKNKTSNYQSAHELSYKIGKQNGQESPDLEDQKNDSKKDEGIDKNENSTINNINNNDNVNETKEKVKNENENDQDDSESSFGLDD